MPVAFQVASLFGTRVAEAILASVHSGASKAGHMNASDLINQLNTSCREGVVHIWHLDEMVCNVGGRQMYLWRAVDDEGEVLDRVMQRQRDTGAALKLLKRLLRNQPVTPAVIVTDRLKSYGAALPKLGLSPIHHDGKKAGEKPRRKLPPADPKA